MILQKKLVILYDKYLKNDFNDNMREIKIKEIFEIKENLKDLKKSIFIPENFEQFLNFGIIIKIKYFGYGIIINIEKKSLKETNDNIITEKILPNEEDNLFFESYEYNNYIYSDLYNDDNYQKKEKIIINNKYLRNEKFLESIITKYTKSSNKNIKDEYAENNEINEKNENLSRE